jgi:sulfate adenylyltransferase subunit 2
MLDDDLRGQEDRSVFILREAYASVRPLGMLWSMGKDSTALLWMARKAFFGRVPFPVILLDTGMELPVATISVMGWPPISAFRPRTAPRI